jgi:antitoxin (DNA-binding transcriptional repressor) of toxin-antitoxin stability system
LKVTFEFHSERITASVKDGERLSISEDGKPNVALIAPIARRVKAGDDLGNPGSSPAAPPKAIRR